jgi:hypothetical protein
MSVELPYFPDKISRIDSRAVSPFLILILRRFSPNASEILAPDSALIKRRKIPLTASQFHKH